MPAPPSVIMQVPFRVGLDEGTDPSQIPPGTLTYVRNGVWNKLGRLETRQGSDALPTSQLDGGAVAGTIARVLARDAELLTTDGATLFSFSSKSNGWKRVQPIQALESTWTTLADTTRSINAADVHATSSYRASAWVSVAGLAFTLFGQVEDVATGARLLPPTQIATSMALFRVLVLGTKAIFIYQASGGTAISAVSVDLLTLAVAAPVVLRNDAINASSVPWDVCINGSNFTLAYQNTSNVVQLYTYDVTLTQQATASVATIANVNTIALHATPGENLYVVYAVISTHLVRLAVHNPATLAQTVAPTTIYTGTGDTNRLSVIRKDASNCIVALTEIILSPFIEQSITLQVSSAGSVNAPSHRISRWAVLASKLFTVGSRFYAFLSSERPSIQIANGRFTQNTTFAVEVATSSSAPYTGNLPHKLCAVVAPREGAIPDVNWQLCGAPVVGSDVWATALYVAEPVSALNLGRNALRLVRASTVLTDPWAPAVVAHDLITAGGVNAVYDGRRQFEIGFLHEPRVITATPSTTGGAMGAGTYQYSFVYEWYDATGLLHRSVPSQPVSVTTTGATSSVVFVLESATTTGKADEVTGDIGVNALPVSIVVYRTVAGGSSFFRLRTDSGSGGVTGVGIIENAAFAANVSWTDTSLDTSIDASGTQLITRPLLYITGGILDEVMPPSSTTQTLHRDRLWIVSGDRRSIWATKKFTEDPSVFPGFHEDLRIVLDVDIVALRSLDDKLAILTATTPYVLFGDGPGANGQGSDWELARVQGDVGCRSARSVVNMPGGIMFLAARGYYSLTRELELQWIGREVKDEVTAFPVVQSATLVPHRSQARIGMSTADESSGVVLVYDYSNGNWSVFTYPNSVVRSSVVVADTWYFTGASTLFVEDDATWLDAGAFVPLVFEVTLTPSGPVAWQHLRRLQLLGEMQTNHDLRIQLAFNGSHAFSQDFTFPAQMVAVNNDCPTVRIGSQNGANPKAKSIRVRASVASPTNPGSFPVGSGRGGWFTGLGLELVPKPGLPRHGARFAKV